MHFCIVLLHIAKLTMICINFAITTVHFVILYKSFLTVLITMNVCTILAESISMLYTLKTHTNVPQQNEHELQNLAWYSQCISLNFMYSKCFWLITGFIQIYSYLDSPHINSSRAFFLHTNPDTCVRSHKSAQTVNLSAEHYTPQQWTV